MLKIQQIILRCFAKYKYLEKTEARKWNDCVLLADGPLIPVKGIKVMKVIHFHISVLSILGIYQTQRIIAIIYFSRTIVSKSFALSDIMNVI